MYDIRAHREAGVMEPVSDGQERWCLLGAGWEAKSVSALSRAGIEMIPRATEEHAYPARFPQPPAGEGRAYRSATASELLTAVARR